MKLLIQLRWLAVGGQLATIGIVSGPMGISLPRAPLLGAILVLIAINFASAALLRRGRGVTNAELTAALRFDVGERGWRSEERRVGEECVSTFRAWGEPCK